MNGIHLKVVKERDYSIGLPTSRLIPQWLIYAAGINGGLSITFMLIPWDRPIYFEYFNWAVGLVCGLYILRVGYHAVTVEVEYSFKLTSSRSRWRELFERLS